MAWWAWMLLGVVIATRWRRGRWRRHMYGRQQGWLGGGTWGMVVLSGRGCGAHGRSWPRQTMAADATAVQPPFELTAAQKRERAMSELRRRYVADDITVEEYERELDRLLREK